MKLNLMLAVKSSKTVGVAAAAPLLLDILLRHLSDLLTWC